MNWENAINFPNNAFNWITALLAWRTNNVIENDGIVIIGWHFIEFFGTPHPNKNLDTAACACCQVVWMGVDFNSSSEGKKFLLLYSFLHFLLFW